MLLDELIKKEHWEVKEKEGEKWIEAYNEVYPYVHPFSIHAKRYRLSKNPEQKYIHLKAMHDYLWPDTIWHSWTERRFRAHCHGWNFITYAGGASCAKSMDAAMLAILFWLGNPTKRTVIVASTSLESLSSRIWGYITKLFNKAAIPIKKEYLSGKPPKILYPASKKRSDGEMRDTIHGMFAVAAKRGDDETVISSWIGRHPDEGLMVILDEATDMPEGLVKALPNLESGVEFFQCMAIGNSLSKFDLHGMLSTPKNGWNSVDPLRDNEWETTQKNGVCLFFSCYESPAIYEKDPIRKSILSKFLINEESLKEKEAKYGIDSDMFYRFVLGFWRSSSTDETVVSKEFIGNFGVFDKAEWTGLYPINMVAGLDPAFSTGGDGCVLRLAALGQDTSGKIVLDYRGEELLFPIKIVASSTDSVEVQIARQVLNVLDRYNVPLSNLCVDANGQGRALGEVIRLTAKALHTPIKIYSTRTGNVQQKSFDVVVKTAYELWFNFRDFIQNGQIKGLDHVSVMQLTTRLIIMNEKTKKQVLESKNAYKTRMSAIAPSLAHSPDEADAAALCLQAAMIMFGFSPGQRRELRRSTLEEEKFLAFLRDRTVPELGDGRDAPPVATFMGDLSGIKSSL